MRGGGCVCREGSECLFISKISEGGTAARDGKLRVGDKILQINGVDVTDARHDQVRISLLLYETDAFTYLFTQRKI